MKKRLDQKSPSSEIKQYLMAEDKSVYEVSSSLLKRLERIDYCRTLIAMDKPSDRIIEELVDAFNVTRKVAYDIYFLTDQVYDVRQIKIEALFSEIAQTKRMAMLKEDIRAAAMADGNKLKAITAFYGDKTQAEYDKLQPPPVRIGFFKELTAAADVPDDTIQQFVEQMKKKAMKYVSSFAEDVTEEL